jgi:ketosteroid isomerase-like protein
MSDADSALQAMCDSYAGAVNASDSARYAKLFSEDAIRMPPGADPEYGAEQIQKAEQADYDAAKWNVKITPRDVLPITGEWIFGIGDVEVSIAPHADGKDVRRPFDSGVAPTRDSPRESG